MNKNTKVKGNIKERIRSKLLMMGITIPENSTDYQIYHAAVSSIRDIMVENRERFKKTKKEKNAKKVCYLCMEFLVGRSLKNVSLNLGIYKELCDALQSFGTSFEKIYEYEVDPGLGNGGLGRLAACFMDSLSANNYAANGYSLLYENGLFKQRIVDGEQVEFPDEWLENDYDWLVCHPEKSVSVRFGGKISKQWVDNSLKITNYEYDEIKAIPYDLLIPGVESETVNTIRLWRAKQSPIAYTDTSITQGSYVKNLSQTDSAEIITKQLYPNDDYDEGKLLRLSQQYFLVSASLQSIINDYFAEHGSLEGFEDNIAIHINDTHPALCIPEIMRIFMDQYSYSWEKAWNIVRKTVSYTNHTVLPEALECWRVDLFSVKLPRIYEIVEEINKKFTQDLWNLYPGDWNRISRMSIIAYNQVRMANLSVVGSHTINGVSKLHSDILKKTVFHDFYKMWPSKFLNVTNGIAHRRWLVSANPLLSDLIEEAVGSTFKYNAQELKKLKAYVEDTSFLERLDDIKLKNKIKFANYINKKYDKKIDPKSIFDVQIKRMHEYKRQLLNLMKIIAIYNDVKNNNANVSPQTFIFGCKAAPGYVMAKKIIKLIWFLAKEISNDPIVKGIINVVFVEDYNVSIAEILIPAADISEQISLAGKEASGTGCMKLMMNGAITLGTMDGANVEIFEAVGKNNYYSFGLNTAEVDELWRKGYHSSSYYNSSEILKGVIDRMRAPIAGESFSGIADYLVNNNFGIADPFMCLADFNSYYNAYSEALKDYQNRMYWNKKALINIAQSGIFSSDVSIENYANKIWKIKPVFEYND